MVELGDFAMELDEKKNNRGNVMIRDIFQTDEFFEKYQIASIDHCFLLKESYVFDNMLGDYFANMQINPNLQNQEEEKNGFADMMLNEHFLNGRKLSFKEFDKFLISFIQG